MTLDANSSKLWQEMCVLETITCRLKGTVVWQRRFYFVPVSLWQYLITLSISFRIVQLLTLLSDHQGSWGDVGKKFFFFEPLGFTMMITLYHFWLFQLYFGFRIIEDSWNDVGWKFFFVEVPLMHRNQVCLVRLTPESSMRNSSHFFCCNFYSKYLRLPLNSDSSFDCSLNNCFFFVRQSLLPLVFCG